MILLRPPPVFPHFSSCSYSALLRCCNHLWGLSSRGDRTTQARWKHTRVQQERREDPVSLHPAWNGCGRAPFVPRKLCSPCTTPLTLGTHSVKAEKESGILWRHHSSPLSKTYAHTRSHMRGASHSKSSSSHHRHLHN